MSLIIVGVGNADFQTMKVLDADEEPLQADGLKMARDIVQFVPMVNFQQAGDPVLMCALLAKEVLAELPDQIVQYFESKGIRPPGMHQ